MDERAPGRGGARRRSAGLHAWLATLPRRRAALLQHLMLAGPVLGAAGAVWRTMLANAAPHLPDPATGQTIRWESAWHGHLRAIYFVTPAEAAVWWCLALPAGLWAVGVVGTALLAGVASIGRPGVTLAAWWHRKEGQGALPPGPPPEG